MVRIRFFRWQRFRQAQFARQGPIELVKHGRTGQKKISFPNTTLIGEKYRQQSHHGVHNRQGVGKECQDTAPQPFVSQTEFIQA